MHYKIDKDLLNYKFLLDNICHFLTKYIDKLIVWVFYV